MKSATFCALLQSVLTLSAYSAFAAKVPLSAVKKNPSPPGNIVPNEFIIEVDNLSNIPTKRSFARSLDVVYAHLQERAVSFDVKKEFDFAGLFVGAAVSINTPQDAATLANAPGVKLIRPVIQYHPPK
jgi:hypothetical protein